MSKSNNDANKKCDFHDMENIAIIEIILSLKGDFDYIDIINKCNENNVFAQTQTVVALCKKLCKYGLIKNDTFCFKSVDNAQKSFQKQKDKLYSSYGYERVEEIIK